MKCQIFWKKEELTFLTSKICEIYTITYKRCGRFIAAAFYFVQSIYCK